MPGLKPQSAWMLLLRAGDDDRVEAEEKSRERGSDGPEEDASFHVMYRVGTV